jgi:prepilin-type N-terminal cleavage/methylation domain-containing protein
MSGITRLKGFTLVELLVIVILIAILACIAVPKMREMPQRSKEASLRSSLAILREAGDRCEADTGFTVDATALLSETPPAHGWRRGQMGTNWSVGSISPSTWKGPYLYELPVNPITGTSNYITGGNTSADWTHWSNQSFNKSYYYYPSSERGLDGTQYKTW